MKIKSEIIYTDTIYYYKKPVPGYICSILSANDPDGKNLNILERDSELELEYILEPNTTMSDIRNAICEKMNKQIGDLCRSCPCICIKSHEDFIEIENMDIKMCIRDSRSSLYSPEHSRFRLQKNFMAKCFEMKNWLLYISMINR